MPPELNPELNRDYDTSLLTDAEKAFLTSEGDDLAPDFYEEGEAPAAGSMVMDPITGEMTLVEESHNEDQPAQPQPAIPAPAADDEIPPTIPQAPDFAQSRAQIEAQRATLKTQRDDGEISDEAYDTQRDTLAEQLGALKQQETSYQTTYAALNAKADALWQKAEQDFRAANATIMEPENLGRFNDIVLRMTKETTGVSYSAILDKARAVFCVQYDRPDLAGPAKPAAKAQAAQPTRKTIQDDANPVRVQPVPTLARMPAAAEESTDLNRWAHIDAMLSRGDTAGFQAAIAKMSAQEKSDFGQYSG